MLRSGHESGVSCEIVIPSGFLARFIQSHCAGVEACVTDRCHAWQHV
jgi:hypothetical protein